MPKPFEALRARLLRAGIAPRHVRAYLAELEDHLAELICCEEGVGYDEQTAAIHARAILGDDTRLVEAMLAQPGFKSLAARAPWLVFGLLPPFATLAVFMVPGVILVAIAKTHGIMAPHSIVAPTWFQDSAKVVSLASDLVLGPALAILLVVMAKRRHLDWKWPLLGIAIIALLAFHLQVVFPTPGHRGGSIGIAPLFLAGVRARLALMLQWPVLLMQFVLTLLPAAWLASVRHRTSEI